MAGKLTDNCYVDKLPSVVLIPGIQLKEDRVIPIDQKVSHQQFVSALQHEPLACERNGCPGPVEIIDVSHMRDRIKTFEARCQQCGWHRRLTGQEQLTPVWDEASLLMMADDHLMH